MIQSKRFAFLSATCRPRDDRDPPGTKREREETIEARWQDRPLDDDSGKSICRALGLSFVSYIMFRPRSIVQQKKNRMERERERERNIGVGSIDRRYTVSFNNDPSLNSYAQLPRGSYSITTRCEISRKRHVLEEEKK